MSRVAATINHHFSTKPVCSLEKNDRWGVKFTEKNNHTIVTRMQHAIAHITNSHRIIEAICSATNCRPVMSHPKKKHGRKRSRACARAPNNRGKHVFASFSFKVNTTKFSIVRTRFIQRRLAVVILWRTQPKLVEVSIKAPGRSSAPIHSVNTAFPILTCAWRGVGLTNFFLGVVLVVAVCCRPGASRLDQIFSSCSAVQLGGSWKLSSVLGFKVLKQVLVQSSEKKSLEISVKWAYVLGKVKHSCHKYQWRCKAVELVRERSRKTPLKTKVLVKYSKKVTAKNLKQVSN